MEKWEKRKWLVNSWIGLSVFTALIFIASPGFLTGILFTFVLLATISARTQYKLAINRIKSITSEINKPIKQPLANQIEQPSKPIQTVKPKKDFNIFVFNVAGVTMENDKNKDIQKLLKRNGKLFCEEQGIELFSGYSNKEIIEYSQEVSEFEDLYLSDDEISFVPEPTNEYDPNAIKIFLEFGSEGTHHVGYVPKKSTKELQNILDTKKVIYIEAKYVGGKIKNIEYDFEKDKDVVVPKELSLGIEISIKYE